MESQGPTYLDTNQLAQKFGIKAQTVRSWRLKGTGPRYIRLGPPRRGRVVYDMREIERWVAARVHRSTSEETVAVRKDFKRQ